MISGLAVVGALFVFVPNVRGSTGYGLRYSKQVDHDWGGQDRLDHVHAQARELPRHLQLLLRPQGEPGGLLTVPQRRIEDDDPFLGHRPPSDGCTRREGRSSNLFFLTFDKSIL